MVRRTTIGGRAVALQTIRVPHVNRNHGYYNRVNGRFEDTGETFSMPATAFAKWAAKLNRTKRNPL